MNFKIYENMSQADYLALDAISRSDLVAMRKGFNYYKWFKSMRKQSKAFTLGDALHALVLEPARFKYQFSVCPPDLNLRTKAGMEWKEKQGDKHILKDNDFVDLENMASGVLTHPIAGPIISASTKELTIVWEMSGLQFKAKLDAVIEDSGIITILDLKSTRTLSRRKLQYAMKDNGYDIQNWLYSTAASYAFDSLNVNFLFVWVDKNAPYNVKLTKLPFDRFNSVRSECTELIEKYKWCLDNDKWPSNETGDIEELDCAFIEGEDPTEEEPLYDNYI